MTIEAPVIAALGGFEDNEIRQTLIRAGALQFKGKGGKEMSGLLERNRLRLQKKSTDDEQAAGASARSTSRRLAWARKSVNAPALTRRMNNSESQVNLPPSEPPEGSLPTCSSFNRLMV
jgi:hypothetical protein